MKIKNIAIKKRLKEIENMQDYYAKVQALCELSGLVAFYGHTTNNTHNELQACEKMAHNTTNMIITKYKL